LLYLPLVDNGTKSTFFLADSRRAALKAIAAERRTTVTSLLAEGADLVIEKYRGLGDRAELERRAEAARQALRRGLYEGTPVAERADSIVYPTRRKKR
jgi:hypothetical protein